MQLYFEPCHMVSAEIAVAMATTIENSTDCELWGANRFLQADEILGYLAEEASSHVELFCCMTMHAARQTQTLLCEQFHWDIFEHPPYSLNLAPLDFFLFPKMKEYLAGKCFVNDEDLKDAVITRLNNQAATWYEQGIHKLVLRYD